MKKDFTEQCKEVLTVSCKKSLPEDVKNCLPWRVKTPYHVVVNLSYHAQILTKSQMAALKTAILEHQLAYPHLISNYAIELALYTGMRLGELAALKWSYIDDLYIHIDYSEHRLDYSGKKSQIVIGEPKNRKHRKIPLTKETRNIFKKIRAHFPYDENGFVFTRPDGTRLTGQSTPSLMEPGLPDSRSQLP